jgi:hypothetical protein
MCFHQYIVLGNHFQKFAQRFLSNIMFETSLFPHCVHWKSCIGLSLFAWLFVCSIISLFCMMLDTIFSMLHTKFGLSHWITYSLADCACGKLINSLGIHLFQCSNGGWKTNTSTHDSIWDAFACIAMMALLLSILHSFYKQRVSIALHKVQAISMLKWSIIVKLNPLLCFPLICLFNSLHVLGKGFKTC